MAKESLPHSLVDLADANTQALARYGIPTTRHKNDREASIRHGQQYIDSAFPASKYNMSPGEVPPRGIGDVRPANREVVEEIVNRGIAIVLLRPEMFHVKGELLNFLQDNAFHIEVVKDTAVTADQLYRLYTGVIRNVRHFRRELPTRSVVYTDSPASLILISDPKKRYGDDPEHMTNGFFREYKGTPAVRQPNTIRGGVVFESACKLGFHDPDEIVGMATDPFGAISHLVKEPEPYWYHSLTPTHLRMLRYTAQGVHIPNGDELPGDLDTLTTHADLLDIHKTLVGKRAKFGFNIKQ